MKKVYLLLLITSITLVLSGSAKAVGTAEVTAFQGKATDARTPDTVMGNTTQLLTRNAVFPDAKKSWLQFDLTDLYAGNPSIQGNITTAKLTVYGGKSETGSKPYAVNGLNDAANLENWIAAAVTWNNGPGNNTASGTALDTSKTTSLYTATIPAPVLDVMSETPQANRAALAAFLNTDTDGKVTFIITPGGTTYLWNAGQPLSPVLTLEYLQGSNLKTAHFPMPADDAVTAAPASLSWTNPDPNSVGGVITCDVYLGTEPNQLSMTKKTLAPGASSVAVNAAFGPLAGNTKYYWVVDCRDSSRVPQLIPGEMWSFYVGQAPSVDAGPDQAVWLTDSSVVVNLNGTTSDNGPYTVLWTKTAGPDVTITPNNVDDTSVTLTARGDYTFTLTADDGVLQASDTVRIAVGNNACDASHLLTGQAYNAADVNSDCVVNLQDFYTAIAEDWLTCTDTLANCQ